MAKRIIVTTDERIAAFQAFVEKQWVGYNERGMLVREFMADAERSLDGDALVSALETK